MESLYCLMYRDVVQMARMQGWGSWGRRFESCHPEIIFKKIPMWFRWLEYKPTYRQTGLGVLRLPHSTTESSRNYYNITSIKCYIFFIKNLPTRNGLTNYDIDDKLSLSQLSTSEIHFESKEETLEMNLANLDKLVFSLSSSYQSLQTRQHQPFGLNGKWL